MKLKLPEKRRYIRIEVPLKINVTGEGWQEEACTKNISPIGIRLEASRKFNESEIIGLSIRLPSSDGPIDIHGKVVWQEKTSTEDDAPYDVGVEIINIAEDHKNALLKYLCDLLYSSSYKARW